MGALGPRFTTPRGVALESDVVDRIKRIDWEQELYNATFGPFQGVIGVTYHT